MPADEHSFFLERVAAIRALILDAFSPRTLRQFCQDRPDFRPLLDEFGEGAGLADMAEAVITHCEKKVLFRALLAEIERVNPRQFERHRPAIYGGAAALCPEPVVSLAALPGWVDREGEMDLFWQMLAGERPQRLLRVLDGGERGKTWLLWRMAYECGQQGVPVALLDFDESRANPPLTDVRSVARQVRRCLGERCTPALCAAEKEIAGGRLPSGPDGDAALGRALVADLAALGRAVVLVDTFERAVQRPDLQAICGWLERWLFDALRYDLPQTLVVVAGRPEPECRRFFQPPPPWGFLVVALDRLAPFSDKEILEHYRLRGLNVTPADTAILQIARLSPARMAQLADWLEQAQRGGAR